MSFFAPFGRDQTDLSSGSRGGKSRIPSYSLSKGLSTFFNCSLATLV